jgi:hypothetical protein
MMQQVVNGINKDGDVPSEVIILIIEAMAWEYFGKPA